MRWAWLLGVGFGAGLWMLFSALFPAPRPLGEALDRMSRPLPSATGDGRSLDARLGARLRRLGLMERLVGHVRADLRVLGRSPDEQAAQLTAYALVGLLWAPLVLAGAALMGFRIPVVVPVWLAVVGAVAALVLAVRHIRQQAAEARAGFAHAVSAYCDVVSMEISAGYELTASMHDAAARGGGWAFDTLREALHHGYVLGERPWDRLSQLGHDLGVNDLVELGATLALAGDEGASVADTLSSKASSMRERLVAETERTAASATERMAVPGAMVLIGFLALLAYPAVHFILQEAGR